MKKTTIILIGLLFVGYGTVYGSDNNHASLFKDRQALREQMVRLLVSMSDLDILVNRDEEVDYDLFTEDAKTILSALDEIKALDKEALFKEEILSVEKPTRKLLYYSEKKSRKALNYTEKIFNACFKCHSMHRDNRDLAGQQP